MTKARWLVTLLLFSCNGSGGFGDAGAPGDGDGDATEYAEEVYEMLCARIRSCCMAEGFDTSALADCEESYAMDARGLTANERGTVRISQPALDACRAQQRAEPEGCAIASSSPVALACYEIFEGTVPSGGECYDEVECARDTEPSICLRTEGASELEPGVCRPLQRVTEGEGCVMSVDEHLFNIAYSTTRSEAEVGLGYCHYDDNLFCGIADRVCRQFLAAGAACDNSGPDLCFPSTHYCDPSSSTCQPRTPKGGACTNVLECSLDALICRDGICSPPTFGDLGLCDGI